MKTLVVCSGGLDSVSLAYMVAKDHSLAGLISFDYGQRHRKELAYARTAADRLQVPHTIIDITDVGTALAGSALTDQVTVPDGHYAEETMKITVVPNRNAIMLTIAFGVGAAKGVNAIAAAMHGGDHFIYPDCRPAFLEAFAAMQNLALDQEPSIHLHCPFVEKSKADIVKMAALYGVPFQDTWSCYKGEALHCGRCGTCVERQEAFAVAEIEDPTVYSDRQFWRTATAQHQKLGGAG